VKSRRTRSGGRVAAGSDLVAGERLSAANPFETSGSHQPFDPAATHHGALAAQLVPHLAGPYRPRPMAGSECTRVTSARIASSAIDLADRGRALAA